MTTTATCHGSPRWAGEPSRRVGQCTEGTGCASGQRGDTWEGAETLAGPWQRPVTCTVSVRDSGAQPAPQVDSPASASAALGFWRLRKRAQPLCPCAELTQPSTFGSLAFNCCTILDRNCFCASSFSVGSGLRTASKLFFWGEVICFLVFVLWGRGGGCLLLPSH